MHSSLARCLISKGVISRGTILQAPRPVKGLSCQLDSTVLSQFVVSAARQIGTKVVFEARGEDEQSHTVKAEDVVGVDGMDIARIAESHSLDLEGNLVDYCSLPRRRRSQIPCQFRERPLLLRRF